MPKIATLTDYVLEVDRIVGTSTAFSKTTTHWFRGQRDSSWHLFPSLYRGSIHPDREREMVRDFRLRSSAFLLSSPENKIEWRFIMQHYGIPTRLLDWTESHLVALYFAVYEFEHACDAAVWIMHPWHLNEQTIGAQTVPVITDDIVSKYAFRQSAVTVEAEHPMAVRPRRTTDRIIAQKGHFTIHGHSKKGIDELDPRITAKLRLHKIEIAGTARMRIIKELFLAGITHSVLFPDLDGLAKELAFRYSNALMR